MARDDDSSGAPVSLVQRLTIGAVVIGLTVLILRVEVMSHFHSRPAPPVSPRARIEAPRGGQSCSEFEECPPGADCLVSEGSESPDHGGRCYGACGNDAQCGADRRCILVIGERRYCAAPAGIGDGCSQSSVCTEGSCVGLDFRAVAEALNGQAVTHHGVSFGTCRRPCGDDAGACADTESCLAIRDGSFCFPAERVDAARDAADAGPPVSHHRVVSPARLHPAERTPGH